MLHICVYIGTYFGISLPTRYVQNNNGHIIADCGMFVKTKKWVGNWEHTVSHVERALFFGSSMVDKKKSLDFFFLIY